MQTGFFESVNVNLDNQLVMLYTVPILRGKSLDPKGDVF